MSLMMATWSISSRYIVEEWFAIKSKILWCNRELFSLLKRFVIVWLQRDFLHGHDVASLVVDRSVHFPKVTLTWGAFVRVFLYLGCQVGLVLKKESLYTLNDTTTTDQFLLLSATRSEQVWLWCGFYPPAGFGPTLGLKYGDGLLPSLPLSSLSSPPLYIYHRHYHHQHYHRHCHHQHYHHHHHPQSLTNDLLLPSSLFSVRLHAADASRNPIFPG